MYGAELAIKKQGETITAESDEKLAKLVADEALSVRGVTKAEKKETVIGKMQHSNVPRKNTGRSFTAICVPFTDNSLIPNDSTQVSTPKSELNRTSKS